MQVTQQAQVYARLHVTDTGSGAQSKVELVGDLLHHRRSNRTSARSSTSTTWDEA